MASPAPEYPGAKRKRSPLVDDPITRPAPPTPSHAGGRDVTKINYLVKTKNTTFKLIEGDADTFGDVLGLIDDYEGILQRQESIAANLGAKLVGPLLLKSFEKIFDGPIKVLQSSFGLEQAPITWLDIVTFARTNPSDFVLNDTSHGKTCRVWMKGGQLEIPEDDYRLIMSGAPERMIPPHASPEDEIAELGTLNILESRLGMLIKKADAVASKARQLNYHLQGRKKAVAARRSELAIPDNAEPRTFSPQPFSAINQSPKPGNEISKVQQELLEQFMANGLRSSIAHVSRPKQKHGGDSSNGDFENRRVSYPPTASEDAFESHHRVLMAAKIEKLARGDVIDPPCDRCRRLRFDCTKHLTACSACTKKHAKCSWKDIKEGELDEATSSGQNASSGENEGSEEPGLVVATLGSSVVDGGDHMQGFMDSTEQRMDSTPSDFAMLTHIASAAAAIN
ncbi:hypothetical protein BJ878DRAFT_147191 [Calycina marina]|uniref:Zn(2)-C6 fungal-type domain-containing protein n=1 Tax=Calycina marina TaxID=1763456 RepID=A0A9P7Z0X4_9HELO|nr:hypothetical protein BJ878DRAFT_147191 [Calycina marina]